jgi:chorismate lyase/3-hydroxybenzoate synthase
MIQLSSFTAPPAPLCAEDSGLLPPAWVDGLCHGGHCLASARVSEARALDREAFQAATARAYRQIRSELVAHGDGLDRYMVFNAGRYAALSEWFGGDQAFDTRVASASGVGHQGCDLVIHCLASDRPGRAVDNPRQTAPYRYSRKYGPLPPCFARATRIESNGKPLVLVGGTASIIGEESVHLGDLPRQTEETLANLATLAPLSGYRELRVYYPDPERLDELRGLLDGAFPRAERIEWVRADLCRSELLVEIEGIAGIAEP